MRMGLSGRLMEFIILMIMLTARAKAAAIQPKPGCQRRCGNLRVPYPFGTENGCFMENKFFIRCDNTSDTPKAFLQRSNIEVLDFYPDSQLRIRGSVASDCYNSSERFYSDTWLRSGLYNISHTRNKFTAIGCDTYAFIQGSIGQSYATGCLSLCNRRNDVINGSCSGIGCCQAAIPRGVRDYQISLASYFNHSKVLSFNPCSYAFVAEDGAYNFSVSDLDNYSAMTRGFPMILDWTIGNQTCSEAKKDPENYACKENTICEDPEFGNGYMCKCIDGFQGNPYLSNDCQDINECETSKPCNSSCHNTIGSFYCSCPEGYEGDGRQTGTGCTYKVKPQNEKFPITQIAIGISIGIFALFLFISWSFLVLRQRKILKLREKYFKQNGGILLREQLSNREGYGENVRIFAADELEKATNNYHESRILGQGGQGTVYKGILPGNRMVAIKKSRIGDQSQVEQFVNEIIVLCQINHRNVVKLLGCCLETPVPMLVYEYVTNGSLFDHMHNVAGASFLPWETRLRIATETAEALSYLHSAACVPIIHRDIKLANILLDDHYTAKVSDFGASRLIPSDKAQITTIVQGTFGYLDPEYMHTSLLTEKSDVYSFGVVLIELLTGQKVVCFERSEEKRVLALYFVSSMKEDRLLEILDPRVLNDVNVEQLKEVAALARQCVGVKGEERPTMKEVAHELAGLQAMEKYHWGKRNLQAEEAEYLLGELSNTCGDYATTSSSMGYDSINNQIAFELDGAR
ncbi:putative wall-associated receptor kinase-like 16 [Durio zibethinus]|uniref:Wall-associated receptor kinase-like 16 n=1 Tax=Durio zibethinus TaxID=66656 RepID=A0A6P5ZMI2_DURZI|nr:putative wall-associated receptor kinase-like 16 [Durio zibethinus]